MAAPSSTSDTPTESGARAALREELGPMTRLAIPVVLAEVGWMAMGTVDTMMVGRVSPEAIGAVSIGSSISFSVAMLGQGCLFGLDYLVSHAFGSGQMGRAHRALIQSGHLSILLGIPLTLLVWVLSANLQWFGISPEVRGVAQAYTDVVAWSLLPLFLLTSIRRYLQALALPAAVTAAVISANLLNAFVNWVLIFGELGAPAMGAVGSAWATTFSRLYMFGFLLVYVISHARKHDTGLLGTSLRPEPTMLWKVVKLGAPAGAQTSLEVGVFSAATLLAGTIGAIPVASHQIALLAPSLTFMVPLGISQAAAARVGRALGAGSVPGARRAGWTAMGLASAFMTTSGAVFFLAPKFIASVFTSDADVILAAIPLIQIAAVFQLADGLQVVATGALRGTGDTRTAAVTSLVCFWGIALPLGYACCFWVDLGVFGLWIGLCTGLILVAITLMTVWTRRRLLPATA